jgi:hypothetical protein
MPLKTQIFLSVLDAGIVFLTVRLGVRMFLTVQSIPASILLQWLLSGTKYITYSAVQPALSLYSG